VPKQCETGSQIIDNQERKRESEWVFSRLYQRGIKG